MVKKRRTRKQKLVVKKQVSEKKKQVVNDKVTNNTRLIVKDLWRTVWVSGVILAGLIFAWRKLNQ